MKHTYLLLAIAAILLTGCEKNISSITTEEHHPIAVDNTPDVYLTGYTLYAIPYSNKYYLMSIEAIDKNGDECYIIPSVYTPALTSASLPYVCNFQNRQLLEDISNMKEFVIKVYWDSTTDYNQTQCLSKSISASEILRSKKAEYTFTSDNGSTKIGIHLVYE